MQSWKVLALVMLAVCANTAQTQQKVVFLRLEEFLPGESSNGDPANAWVADLDGSNQVKITSSRWVSRARWLDEKTVAVISEGDIWLVSVDSRAKTRLTKGEYIDSLACSKDGQTIYCAKTKPEVSCSIFQMNRNGKNRQQLTETNEIFMPLLAASGDHLFFADSSDDKTRVRSLSFVDKEEEVIFQASRESSSIFSFACDEKGEHVAFSLIYHGSGLKAQLMIVNVLTGQSSELCKIDSGGCYGCSFINNNELIFNDGNRLYRMKFDAKGGKYSRQKIKTLITDVIDPDVY